MLILKSFLIFCAFFHLLILVAADAYVVRPDKAGSLRSLLPQLPSWKLTENPMEYFPGSLFEYINGAAEIYLSYDFQKLIVGQYGRVNSSASLTLEIYDMENTKNAFGIYSVERFPESKFINLGNGAYVEEGVLNFIVGPYYIKILCFDCGERSEEVLVDFASGILKNVKDKGELPPLLKAFPAKGLVRKSEKYILRNFLGHEFFHDGYLAQYSIDGKKFECFIIEANDIEEAKEMAGKYLDWQSKEGKKATALDSGFHFKDRYYKNVFLGRRGRFIFGVLRIEDGDEDRGEWYLRTLSERLK
ncbi:MAG: DUF6599 family protein [Candidatus Aminicenantales bacterium]